MQDKKQISIFVPLKRVGDNLVVYLQKRSADNKTLPNYFGFWGGHRENDETPEETLVREIKEETGIMIDLKYVELFNQYEFVRSIKSIYLFRPEDGWEDSIVIGEGDYGKWFSIEEAMATENIILEDKVVLNDLERVLLKKPIR